MCEIPGRPVSRMPYGLHLVCSATAATIGLIFNGYILFVLLWQRRIQTANTLLLLHLAFVDTVFCLVVLTWNLVIGVLSETTNPSRSSLDMAVSSLPPEAGYGGGSSSSCQLHGFTWSALPVVVIWTVCGLSCDRYAAISTPLHYSRLVNTRRAFLFVAASWFVGGGLALPPLIGVCSYQYSDARSACSARCSSSNVGEFAYAIVYSSLAVLFPAVIILICNLHILLIARYHRHRIVSAIYEVTLRAQATVTHQRNPCYLSKFKGRDAFFTITQIMGSLIVLAAPYFGVLVWETTTSRPLSHALVSVTMVLLTCMPPVNAYVYGVKSRVLRQTFKRLLQRYLYKQQASIEIDRRLSMRGSSTGPGPVSSRRFSAPAAESQYSNHDQNHQVTTPKSQKLSRRQSDIATTRAVTVSPKVTGSVTLEMRHTWRRTNSSVQPSLSPHHPSSGSGSIVVPIHSPSALDNNQQREEVLLSLPSLRKFEIPIEQSSQ